MASLNDMKKKNLQNTKEYKQLYLLAVEVSSDLASDNLKQVKSIIDKWASTFGKNGTHMDYDDFCSMANIEIWKIAFSFDPDKNDNMKEYIKSRLENKMKQTENMHNREKRVPYLRDKNGKLILDKEKKPTILHNKNMDEKNDNGCLLSDTFDSGFDIFDEINMEYMQSEKIKKYLSRLSILQRKIIKLMCIGYEKKDIKKKLHIDDREYINNLLVIRSYENKKILID